MAQQNPHEPKEPRSINASDMRELVERTLHEGWLNRATGERKAFIEGVRIQAVVLEGSAPRAALNIRFEAAQRPGVIFVSRFDLYEDEEPVEWREIPILLKERLEGARGLPPPEACVPDENGLVRY